MKIAIVGSRKVSVDISSYMPDNVTEIISGGAHGIDSLAEEYADKNKLSKHIIRPRYDLYKTAAPLIRNKEIVEESDFIIAFWDGKSKGTKNVIDYANRIGKEIQIVEV